MGLEIETLDTKCCLLVLLGLWKVSIRVRFQVSLGGLSGAGGRPRSFDFAKPWNSEAWYTKPQKVGN